MGSPDLVMGLDISMTATGVAVVSLDCRLIHSCVIGAMSAKDVDPELDCIRRGVFQARKLIPIIKEYELEAIAVEGPAYNALSPRRGRNGATTMVPPHRISQLWQLTGVVKHAALQTHGGTMVIIPPASLKKHVTGDGRADKKAMIAAVNERMGITVRDNNIADAIGLCLYHIDGAIPVKKMTHKRRTK